jgi:hypothetical protein
MRSNEISGTPVFGGLARPRINVLKFPFREVRPSMLTADMGIAHGRADTLVAEELLDFA